MSEWKKYTGSDEQIADLGNAKNGFVWRDSTGYESIYKKSLDYLEINERVRSILNDRQVTHYWIISDDPLREMKIRQAQTGQPVWIKMKSSTYWVIAMRGFDLIYQDHVVSVIKSTTPDWWIPNAEYSFTPFEKEIESKEDITAYENPTKSKEIG